MNEWFAYDLPEDLIAQEPLEDRAASRLLWLHKDSGKVEHRHFRDAMDILQPGDLLVLNNTRVTALRIFGSKSTGAKVEALLLSEENPGEFVALVKPAKKLQPGTVINFENRLEAEVTENLEDGQKRLKMLSPDYASILAEIGQTPLPPYIHARLDNPNRYQTVYAETGGSAAAPTAGLHFTPEIFEALKAKGVETAFVTLNVGIDTFRPISAETPAEHQMHGETCHLARATADAIANTKGRIIAVGTTSVRTLESFAIGPRKVETGSRSTKLFIRPGYEFKVIDGMFTNFHMPRTTMLLMLAALAGSENVEAAYLAAITDKYRFLSFGDSMLVL